MNMEDAVRNLYSTYGRFGITKEEMRQQICDGIENYELSLNACYNGLRMALGLQFGVHEFFSVGDVSEITGESAEEIFARIEECRQELIAAGKNPDDYFQPVQSQESTVYYFPRGLK